MVKKITTAFSEPMYTYSHGAILKRTRYTVCYLGLSSSTVALILYKCSGFLYVHCSSVSFNSVLLYNSFYGVMS